MEYCPDLVFFGESVILSLSKSISPNCFGEARLKLELVKLVAVVVLIFVLGSFSNPQDFIYFQF